MKQFILKCILFFLMVISVDFMIGILFSYLTINAQSGGNLKNNYIAYNMNEEVLILGSSRAAHHYKPVVFSDTLDMSCYNCGRDGNGIVLMYGRYKMLKKRYTPKIIIYDVMSDFDIYKNDNIKYLSDLKKYFKEPEVKEIFNNVSKIEGIKMLSHMYRHNSTILNTLSNYCKKDFNDNNGYLPVFKEMEVVPVNKHKNDVIECDELKLYYLEKLIQECIENKTLLFFTLSPFYFDSVDTSIYTPIENLCAKYSIPFIKYEEKLFSNNKHYFSDSNHLNDKGATIYSSMIASIIKDYLSEKH